MKHRILSLAFLTILSAACQKPNTETKPELTPDKIIVIQPSEVLDPVIASQGGTAKVSFTAMSDWQASVINTRADDWCTVSPSSGPAGSATITIATETNDSFEDRSATIVITCNGATRTVKVTQKQNDNITLTSSRIELPSEGGDFRIEMMSNVAYDYMIGEDCRDWISTVDTKAYERTSLVFTAKPNMETVRREGTIEIIATGIKETVHIYQAGEKPSLVLTENRYEVGADGGLIAIEVSSNVDVTIHVDAGIDWMQEIISKSMSTCSFTFNVKANETTKSRSAGLTVKTNDGSLSERIVVNQAGMTPVAVSGVSLDHDTLELTEEETAVLTATVLPVEATDRQVAWSSSNDKVATVDGGTIKARTQGTAVITATTVDGGFTASCRVTVKEKNYPVTGITLSRANVEMAEGDELQLTASIEPSNASMKTIRWASSNTAVVGVENGLVKALLEGNAKVTATTEDGGFTAECDIAVKKKIVHVTSLSLDKSFVEMEEGEDIQLSVTVLPENATTKTVGWTSSDDKIASVSEGKVTAHSTGNVTITATATDGNIYANCTIYIRRKTIHVESISLDRDNVEMTEGEKITLNVRTVPSPVSNGTITWSSSVTTVASVENGEVTALSEGTAVITATSNDGGHQATCNITVKKKSVSVTSVVISKSSVELIEGETAQITAIVLPDDATDKTLIWTSDDEGVVTVENGTLTAVAPGTATIMATAKNGDASASCTVTVKRKPVRTTGVSLSKKAIELTEGLSETLVATVHPDDADDKSITWTSDNPDIASVINGTVTAHAVGTTTITVTTSDGNHTDKCTVKVNKQVIHVSGISLDKTELTLKEGSEAQLTATVTPSDADNVSVEWSSTDESIATVSPDGKVKALKEGRVLITATAMDGGLAASCPVTVKRKPLTNEKVGFEKW